MNGIIIVNKPQNITSHDAVMTVRRRLHINKVGHAGTLDPLATGVLVILVGKATKLFSRFANLDKEYEAVITLGAFTATGDSQGKVTQTFIYDNITKEAVLKAFEEIKQRRYQIPHMYSALHFKGERLYNLARKGIDLTRQPRQIKIYNLNLLNFSLPDIHCYIKCSKGTYIRSFAEDVGKFLNCGAFISNIKRISVGPYNINRAVELGEINEGHIRSWQEALAN